MFKKLNALLNKYEHIWSPVSLVVGFAIDSLTLQKVDDVGSQIFLITYLSIVFLGIIFSFKYKKPIFLLIIQFFMGGLFSAFFVFSIKSSSFGASWPFITFILGYLIANEFLKKYYEHLMVRIGVFTVALYSFMIFFVPTFLNNISRKTFIISGVSTLFVVYVLILILFFINKKEVRKHFVLLLVNIIVIFGLINGLYFIRAIPPLPLSMKEMGLYSNVYRSSSGDYIKTDFKDGDIKSPVFLYASVFAPFQFDTNVYHVWEEYDETLREWKERSRIRISIAGGREGGYRTYSEKKFVKEGKWRVSVVTRGDLIIERKVFEIKK